MHKNAYLLKLHAVLVYEAPKVVTCMHSIQTYNVD